MPDRPDPAAVTSWPNPDPGRGALAELVTPARLQEFFSPRSVALVGASENSGWARNVVASCARAGFSGPLMPVHPRAKTAFDLPVVPSLRELPEPADLAYLIVPVPAIEGILDDMAAADIKNAVILASGYRETGPEGLDLERAMVARAVTYGITVLGPNCMGFVNAHAQVAPYGLLMPQITAGPVGVALQSGALVSWVTNFANAHAIGVSTVVSMGNEAMITVEDMISYLVEDEATKVVCLFLEEINDLAGFARAAHRADQAGKPIVAVKAGSSPAGQQAALVHTGAVAGDEKVVDAVLRQLNVIRVQSIEELLTTAAALCYHRWPTGRRMGVVSASGGANDMIADMASANDIEIPEFAPQTVDGITPLLPPFMSARNPLDVSAFGLANVSQQAGALSIADCSLDIAVNDPNLDFVLYYTAPPAARPATETAGVGSCTASGGGAISTESQISQSSPPASCTMSGPAGEIYRLKASVATPGCAATSPQAAILITAFRNYGIILADNGMSGGLIGTPDARWNDNDLECITSLTLGDFEPVNVSSLMVAGNDSGATTN